MMNAKGSRMFWVAFATFYCLAVLSQTLGGTQMSFDFRGELNLVPLTSLIGAFTSSEGPIAEVKLKYLLGNLSMFVPLALYLAYRGRRLLTAAAGAGGLSVALEALQFALVGYRSADIDDVILNTAGAAIAWLGWRVLNLPRTAPDPHSSPAPPAP